MFSTFVGLSPIMSPATDYNKEGAGQDRGFACALELGC